MSERQKPSPDDVLVDDATRAMVKALRAVDRKLEGALMGVLRAAYERGVRDSAEACTNGGELSGYYARRILALLTPKAPTP